MVETSLVCRIESEVQVDDSHCATHHHGTEKGNLLSIYPSEVSTKIYSLSKKKKQKRY